ncbi:unnamed protein product [Bursaphelenchus xylophilus]|uniref:(pine wood nematode) hypothetical protein n=1 Tax=Bursaphelenchus xylophilus TaxID=6326 RepID=A0A1I7SLL0_BURXY|nr:unnamed protein product [Bursaphelenchus xylophilus]CAG9129658.1 unnamed protein product [Bursaphelenchus xylophilus]
MINIKNEYNRKKEDIEREECFGRGYDLENEKHVTLDGIGNVEDKSSGMLPLIEEVDETEDQEEIMGEKKKTKSRCVNVNLAMGHLITEYAKKMINVIDEVMDSQQMSSFPAVRDYASKELKFWGDLMEEKSIYGKDGLFLCRRCIKVMRQGARPGSHCQP